MLLALRVPLFELGTHILVGFLEGREVPDLVREAKLPSILQSLGALKAPNLRPAPVLGLVTLCHVIEGNLEFADASPQIEQIPRLEAIIEHVPLVAQDLL